MAGVLSWSQILERDSYGTDWNGLCSVEFNHIGSALALRIGAHYNTPREDTVFYVSPFESKRIRVEHRSP